MPARQAERAFNFERGYTTRTFIPCESWDTLHEGLLAGERLQLALRTMEKAYLDANVREYELTKHISLRLHFPLQFLQLKTTGACEIEIPEWMFDLDYPGQYMRRIKNVTLTIPVRRRARTPASTAASRCSAVRCASIRRCRVLRPHAAASCECENEYETCHCDPRIVRQYGAREAIATSSGQNDSGLFELSFRDERYLPFEFLGAVSRWRIELPRENNFFDMDTLTDVVFSLNYTAREGGDVLSAAANEAAQCHVRHGWSLFDVRNEFPDAWHVFQSGTRRDRECDRLLTLSLTRRLFPFLPCDRALMVAALRHPVRDVARRASTPAARASTPAAAIPAPTPARAAAGASRTSATATRTPAPTARRTAAASAFRTATWSSSRRTRITMRMPRRVRVRQHRRPLRRERRVARTLLRRRGLHGRSAARRSSPAR